MADPTEICFSQFERLEVQSQGVGRFGFCWGLSSWLPGRRLLAVSAHGSFSVYSQQHPWCLFPSLWGHRSWGSGSYLQIQSCCRVGLHPVNVGDAVQSVPREYSSNAAVKGRRWCAGSYSIRQDAHWIVPTGRIGCRPRCEPNKRASHRTGGCSGWLMSKRRGSNSKGWHWPFQSLLRIKGADRSTAWSAYPRVETPELDRPLLQPDSGPYYPATLAKYSLSEPQLLMCAYLHSEK